MKNSTKAKLVIAGLMLSLFLQTVALVLQLSKKSTCYQVADDAQHQEMPVGFAYDGKRWTNTNGRTVGYSRYEDSIVYLTTKCAQTEPRYNEAP